MLKKCSGGGYQPRRTGAVNGDFEAGILVTVDNTILHRSDGNDLGDVPVARSEGGGGGADLSIR